MKEMITTARSAHTLEEAFISTTPARYFAEIILGS